MVAMVGIIFSGCSGSDEKQAELSDAASKDTQTEEVAKPEPEEKSKVVIESADEKPENVVKLNDVIKIDEVCEAKLISKEIANTITPQSTGGYYTYYEAESGKVYVDLLVQYTNKENTAVDVDNAIVGCTLTYDNEYYYDGFCVGEYDDRTHMGTNAEVEPLSDGYIHLLFEVPKEVKNSDKKISITFVIDGESFLFNFRK